MGAGWGTTISKYPEKEVEPARRPLRKPALLHKPGERHFFHSGPGNLFTRIEGPGSPWGLAGLYTDSDDHSHLNYKKMGVVLGSGEGHRSQSIGWKPLQGSRLMHGHLQTNAQITSS